MKIIAIITEYNPFHCGHAYQIKAAREYFGIDSAVMVAMSGCFTQRGEPALLDKWTRTQAALDCGVDLVIELPFAYATASAERFASGGVGVFQATGLNAHLVFGSESGNLQELKQVASLLAAEPEAFRLLLRENLSLGLSFPVARQKAVAQYSGDEKLASILSESNNILAIEYLKALQKNNSDRIRPHTIARQGQAYNDRSMTADPAHFASARSIRSTVSDYVCPITIPDYYNLISSLCQQMPSPSLARLLSSLHDGPGVLFPESIAPLIIARLRSVSDEALARIPGMEEGLGQRLRTAAGRTSSANNSIRLENLLDETDTKRFTRTRIQRAIIALLAGITHEDYSLFDTAGGPQYLRVLGFSRRGRHLLKLMRKLAEKPILTRASDFLQYGSDKAFCRMSELDLLASDMWMLTAGLSCGHDFDTPVYMR